MANSSCSLSKLQDNQRLLMLMIDRISCHLDNLDTEGVNLSYSKFSSDFQKIYSFANISRRDKVPALLKVVLLSTLKSSDFDVFHQDCIHPDQEKRDLLDQLLSDVKGIELLEESSIELFVSDQLEVPTQLYLSHAALMKACSSPNSNSAHCMQDNASMLLDIIPTNISPPYQGVPVEISDAFEGVPYTETPSLFNDG